MEEERRPRHNPEGHASYLSSLLLTWMSPIIQLAQRRPLTHADLYQPSPDDNAEKLDLQFYQEWRKELVLAKREVRSPSLVDMIRRIHYWTFFLTGIVAFMSHIFTIFFFPTFVQIFIGYFDSFRVEPIKSEAARICAVCLCICYFLNCALNCHVSKNMTRVGLKVRLSTTALIYRKVLQMRKTANVFNEKHIEKLMSVDTHALALGFENLHYIWLAPLSLITVSRGLYNEFDGASSFIVPFIPGLIFIAIATVLQSKLIKLCAKVSRAFEMKSNERNKLLRAIITGIRTIKTNLWEKPYMSLMQKMNDNQFNNLQVPLIAVNLLSNASFSLLHVFIMFGMFVASVTSDYPTSVEKIALCCIYFHILQTFLVQNFPPALEKAATMFYASLRIENFLLSEITPRSTKSKAWIYGGFGQGGLGVVFDNVTVLEPSVQRMDEEDSPSAKLNDVDFSVSEGLVCICGSSGSGKTTLLLAAAGELPIASGTVKLSHLPVYIPKQACIFKQNARNNVICDREFNEELYNKVVEACHLQDVFAKLVNGDETILGKGTSNLTHDDLTKIALARALYADAKIYLLHNIFDQFKLDEAQQLFDNCIIKFLKGKICILETNNSDHLKAAEKVIFLENRQVSAIGLYDEMVKKQGLQIMMKENKGRRQNGVESADPFSDNSSLSWQAYSQVYGVNLLTCVRLLFVGNEWPLTVLFFIMSITSQVLYHMSDVLLLSWAEYHDAVVISPPRFAHLQFRVERTEHRHTLDNYCTCVFVFVTLVLLTSSLFILLLKRTYTKVHHLVLSRIISGAPSQFLSTDTLHNFMGHITAVDQQLMFFLAKVPGYLLPIFGCCTVTIIFCPVFNIPIVAFTILSFYSGSKFLKTCRSISQLEEETKSWLGSHLSKTLSGLETIRTLDLSNSFHATFLNYQNSLASTLLVSMTAKSWLSMHIHTLSLIYLGIFTAFAYSNHSQFTAVEIVIILVTFWSTVGSYTEFLYTVATLEREHSSVDKCLEFAGTNVRENIIAVHTEKKLGSQLLFTDINFERGGSKLLSNVNFCISEGEKIGILGLSDKSKDAFVDILMKITNPTKGTVSIDGVDMSKLHSQSVRRAITHIPTKTALFSTTLRNNLDPSHNYSNTEIWKVLNQVGLKSRIESTPNQLNCDVYRDLKLQAGELSLVSFIRGILKKSPIVIIEDLPLLGEDSARERQLLLQMINKKFCTATKLILTNKPNADLLIDCQRILQVRDGTFHELGK